VTQEFQYTQRDLDGPAADVLAGFSRASARRSSVAKSFAALAPVERNHFKTAD
jgi:hypothetical protein